jgi:transposase
MSPERAQALPERLRETLRPLLEQVAGLTASIKDSDRKIEQIARTEYPAMTSSVFLTGIARTRRACSRQDGNRVSGFQE